MDYEFNGEYGDNLQHIAQNVEDLTRLISELDPESDVEAAIAKMEELNGKCCKYTH
jgi:hypothetical protein